MRCELFIAALFGMIVVAVARLSTDRSPFAKLLRPHMGECASMLSEETGELLREDPSAINTEIGCFYACLMAKAGLMDGNKMNMPHVEALIMAASDNPELGRLMVSDIKRCRGRCEVSSNMCEVGARYMKCLRATARG